METEFDKIRIEEYKMTPKERVIAVAGFFSGLILFIIVFAIVLTGMGIITPEFWECVFHKNK